MWTTESLCNPNWVKQEFKRILIDNAFKVQSTLHVKVKNKTKKNNTHTTAFWATMSKFQGQ